MGPFIHRELRVQSHRSWSWKDGWRLCCLPRAAGDNSLSAEAFSETFWVRMRPLASITHEQIPALKVFLPGGYTNEFITGPMVSPNVWGSLATAGIGDAGADSLTARWYSASALDYYLRKHFTHGITFGNINGMSSQFLSAAPAGYVEAFQRKLAVLQAIPPSAVRGCISSKALEPSDGVRFNTLRRIPPSPSSIFSVTSRKRPIPRSPAGIRYEGQVPRHKSE